MLMPSIPYDILHSTSYSYPPPAPHSIMGIHSKMTTPKYMKLEQEQDQDQDSSTSPAESNNDMLHQHELHIEKQHVKRLERKISIQTTLLGVLSIILFGVVLTYLRDQRIKIPDSIYSPAQHLVKYKSIKVISGFGKEKTPYSGYPNDENNKAWEDLYNYGIIKIPQSEAAKLINTTMPLPTDPISYVVEIDVFHQLHCLNHIRKVAWGVDMGQNNLNETEKQAFDTHLDHCINSVRQSLMCSSDISTIHWIWVEEDGLYEADGRTMHMCRDFEAIREWTFANRVGKFDRSIHVSDPLAG